MNEESVLLIEEAYAHLRLDQALASLFAGHYSRTYFQWLIEQGLVLVNQNVVKKRQLVIAGDEIEIQFVPTQVSSLSPKPMDFEIIYEDDHLLVINKPPGLVVHPAPGNWDDTFVHGLLAHCQGSLALDDSLRPGIVHRLDKDTSGLLLAAKTKEAQQKCTELFASRSIHKEYIAICHGSAPAREEILAPIGRHPTHRQKMQVHPEGRSASTVIEPVVWKDSFGLVRCLPKTGRTHQIRVHLKHRGLLILGDALYGSPSLNQQSKTPRQLLHALRLSFIHPITQKPLSLTAPIPPDFLPWLQKLSFPIDRI